jgi:hypothetical protein
LARALLEGVQQDGEVARALIEDSVAGVGETDAELTQFPFDLGGDRKTRRGCLRGLSVQMLLDRVIDLGGPLPRQ